MFLEWAVHISLHATTQTPLWPEADFLRPSPPAALYSYYDDPTSLNLSQLEQAVPAIDLILPTPGEMFASFRQTRRPDWSDAYPMLAGRSPGNRLNISAGLGVAFADAELAIEARDTQQLAIQLERMQNLGRALGLDLREMGRINNLQDFARQNLWSLLKSELEATANELSVQLASQRDERLMAVIEVSQWIRAMEILSQLIDSQYDREATGVLQQGALMGVMAAQLESAFQGRPEHPQILPLTRILRDLAVPMEPDEPSGEALGQIQVNRISRELSRFLREATTR